MWKQKVMEIMNKEAERLEDSDNPIIQAYVNGFQTAVIILEQKIKKLDV